MHAWSQRTRFDLLLCPENATHSQGQYSENYKNQHKDYLSLKLKRYSEF